MAKKKVDKTNEIKKEMGKVEWMKNPLLYSQIGGDVSLMQKNILINVAACLQDKIRQYYDTNAKKRGQLSLFTDEELSGDTDCNVFYLNASELGVGHSHYDDLEEACKMMTQMRFHYIAYNEKTGYMMKYYAPLFARIGMPYNKKNVGDGLDGKRRKGMIEVVLLKSNMKALFDMQKGYVEHMRQIVPLCSRKRTPSLYIYLSKYKDIGHKKVKYSELKEYLGDYEYDDDGNVVSEMHPKFSKFCERVIDPVQKEMKALADDDFLDIYFEYEPVYERDVTRGNPDYINFKIYLSKMGREHKLGTKSNMDIYTSPIEKPQNEFDIAKNELNEEEKKAWGEYLNDLKGNSELAILIDAISLGKLDGNVYIFVPTQATYATFSSQFDKMVEEFSAKLGKAVSIKVLNY